MPPIYLTYALPVVLGLVVLFAFPLTKDMARTSDRQRYWTVQAVTFMGAIVGAKVSAVMGDTGWPLRESGLSWQEVLSSGRSITGGLLGGWLGGEVAKPLFGYRLPPNDRFAAVLPFSLAIGRLGCHLTGCCLGRPWHGPLAVRFADGVPRWPVQLMEVGFHLVAGVTLVSLVRRGVLRFRLFSLYLAVYGAWRFGMEFIRATPRYLGPLSVYQGFALAMVLLGAGLTAWRTVHPPHAEGLR